MGFATAIPTPKDVLAYPGREAEWSARVTLRGLTIEDGVATADFSQELRAYGGGSARVWAIREQVYDLNRFLALMAVPSDIRAPIAVAEDLLPNAHHVGLVS
jgi:hypothetical protein